jgi:fermentation-respiration switch protein FrsA (DUF1100 family)
MKTFPVISIHNNINGEVMKKLFAVLILFTIGFVSAQQDAQQKYDSMWEGKLNFNQNLSLRVVVKIQKNEDGTLSGFLDSPDQGAKDIPATSVTITDDSLKFEVKPLGASYAGKIDKDSMIVNGVFKQGMAVIEAKLKKTNKIEEARRPQLPVKPYPYNEEEIVFPNESVNISLAGTLTYPKGSGKFPAVVLITGSGRQDRDETVFNHKPFLVIADYLTRNGIAVLRFDDRGGGKSTGDHSNATTEDFATDAAAAVKYLKSRNEIDSKKIGLIGHSEGGLIAPMTAVNSGDVSFIVLLAGPGVAGKYLLALQTELILRANGMPEEEIAKNVKQSKEAYEAITSSPDSLTGFKRLKEMFDEEVAGLSDEEKQKPEYSESNFNAQTKVLLSPWFRFFLKYDPAPVLENISIPVLALNGDKDLQVDAEQNLTAIEKALKDGGNANYKIVKLPGLNHMFQTAKTGAVNEYAQIEETFSPSALKLISDWIKETVKM